MCGLACLARVRGYGTSDPSLSRAAQAGRDVTSAVADEWDVTGQVGWDVTEQVGWDVTEWVRWDVTERVGWDVTEWVGWDVTDRIRWDVTGVRPVLRASGGRRRRRGACAAPSPARRWQTT